MQSLVLALALVLTSCHLAPATAAANDPTPPPTTYRGMGR
jgi:hypothetical protein